MWRVRESRVRDGAAIWPNPRGRGGVRARGGAISRRTLGARRTEVLPDMGETGSYEEKRVFQAPTVGCRRGPTASLALLGSALRLAQILLPQTCFLGPVLLPSRASRPGGRPRPSIKVPENRAPTPASLLTTPREAFAPCLFFHWSLRRSFGCRLALPEGHSA